ncbi:MAG TPA: peptide chain release factor N(5)-glutamine methyltransferase [Actinomycetota bacterium]|nr:peptide chain release factor N(5)-glutamine methyltransferase [Actinomycetota bacterium]
MRDEVAPPTDLRPTMRPSELVRRATAYLERHGIENPGQNAEALLLQILGTDRARLYARTTGLDAREARIYGRALCQRCTGTPLQHLTGEQPFRRISVHVRPGVFVPRPETEVLVGDALDAIGAIEDPVVVDVGTGTGAIALSIKHERPDATVFATDISGDAVDLARDNAARLELDVTVVQGDLLEPLPPDLRGWVDLVVSDPPYVTPDEYAELPAEVRADPDVALLGGVEVYRRLGREAARWLRDGGVIAVEVGERHAAEVVDALGPWFADISVERDLAGRDRVVLARRP